MRTTWFDASAAKQRLSRLAAEMQKLHAERTLIEMVLKSAEAVRPGRAEQHRAPSTPARRPGRPPSRTSGRRALAPKISLVSLIAEALRFAPSTGMTVAEIIAHIARNHPDRPSAPGASVLVGAAAAQASKAKVPRIKVVTKGARGVPARYGPA